MDEHAGAADPRVAELEAVVRDLRQLVQDQALRIDALEGASAARPSGPGREGPVAPAATAATSGHPAPEGGLGRRRLLVGGATAAAAAAAAVVASSSPAAAADGASIILGSETNQSSSMTTVTGTVDGFPVLNVVNGGTGAALQGINQSDTIAAIRGENTSYVGVYGYSGTLYGVQGESGYVGVYGISEDGPGVWGTSTTGDALLGSSTSGRGLAATSETAIGVYGESGTATGVKGVSASGPGVSGFSESNSGGAFTSTTGTALQGISAGGTGVNAQSTLGPALRAASDVVNLHLVAGEDRPAPTKDGIAHARGQVVADGAGDLWVCVADGTPGTWRKVAGPASAGAFHLLPNPVRVYDSRPGNAPEVGSKTKLLNNKARELSVTANSSGVPAGAIAVSVTLLLVDASPVGGNFTLWASGSPRPAANAMVWGGTAGRFASTAVTRIGPSGKVYVAASSPTNLALDVVGYYL